MAATNGTVIPFTGGDADTLAWRALSIRNAARNADGAFASIRSAADKIADSSRLEAQLAADAAELNAILQKLATDVGALRSRYL